MRSTSARERPQIRDEANEAHKRRERRECRAYAKYIYGIKCPDPGATGQTGEP